jgi:uncharacterized protein YndB with AHSA1/START domain
MTTTHPRDAVVIERLFEASRDVIWQMWTDPAHFAAWYGPAGATIPEARMDVRVGGRRLVAMQMETPGGSMQMWFTGEYLEVDAPRRLVYTEAMADEAGEILSPAEMGMPLDQPTVTEITVELETLGDRTRMTMTHTGIPADSPGAAGWNMAFDKLATHLDR